MAASHRSTTDKLTAGTCLHRCSLCGGPSHALNKRKLWLRQSAIKQQQRGQKGVVIQCGANLGWASTGQEPARLAVVLIDGKLGRDASVAGMEMAS